VYNADGQEASVTVLAAQDAADMTRYFNFRTRKGRDPIAYDESSVILTEKTAENLGVAVGDTIWVANSDGVRVPLTLTGVTENYLFTRLYLSAAQLRALEGDDVAWNAVLAATTCETDADTSALSEAILAKNYISSVTFAEAATSTFSNIISCINYVVLLVIVCAAALAAVVLYNLINVNLAERKKELATIKVLGFYDKEVYRYIFREIELLSLIGAFVGLAIGVPLHQFIIRTVEIDQMMFIRSIAPSSYVYSVALTMVFALTMCVLMRRQVKNISMVESMKAPE
jgi:putative ABC transport system permease protein